MKKFFSLPNMVAVLALIACSICISSFRQDNNPGQNSFRTAGKGDQDTTPPRKPNRNADEFRLNKLDEAMRNLSVQMLKLDERLRDIDLNNIQKHLDVSLSKLDYNKIEKEINESINKADWNEVETEIKSSIEKVKRTDMEKVRKELEKVNLQFDREGKPMQFNSDKLKNEANKTMEKAKAAIEKAKDEMNNVKDFTNALEKDGLIDKRSSYKIQVENGELFINGQKQSKDTSDKYRKFYKKNNFTIQSDDESKDWI